MERAFAGRPERRAGFDPLEAAPKLEVTGKPAKGSVASRRESIQNNRQRKPMTQGRLFPDEADA